MFFLLDLLFVLAIALLLTVIFAVGFRKQEVGVGLLMFFVILFLATWAGGVWIAPFGPTLWGVSWLTFLMAGVIFALLLTALTPPTRPPYTQRGEAIERVRAETDAIVAFDLFFWVLMIGFIIIILVAYL